MNEKASLLIVENDTTLLELLARNFNRQGYHVTTTGCPQEALSLAAKQLFDGAMLDGRLPTCDGLQLMQELQQIQPRLPIIILSARAETEFQQHCLDAGAFAYLRKPSSLDQIESTVAAACLQTRTEPRTGASDISLVTIT